MDEGNISMLTQQVKMFRKESHHEMFETPRFAYIYIAWLHPELDSVSVRKNIDPEGIC